MSVVRSGAGKSLYPTPDKNFVSEATLTGGAGATTLDINATLGKNGQRGYVANDGAADLKAAISTEGSNFSTAFTIKAGEKFDLTGTNVDSIKLTPDSSTDSDYRVLVY